MLVGLFVVSGLAGGMSRVLWYFSGVYACAGFFPDEIVLVDVRRVLDKLASVVGRVVCIVVLDSMLRQCY